MVSSVAEQRRQQFIAAKAAAGGTAQQLSLQVKNTAARVFFDDDGNLMCITKDRDFADIDPHWHCHEFSDEQIAILQDANWNLYRVKKDPLVDNLFSIEAKPLESQYVLADDAFLSEVGSCADWDVKCTVKKKTFSVKLSKQQKQLYSKHSVENIIARGQKAMKFYFTAPADPHYLFHSVTVLLPHLVGTDCVTVKLPADLTACSVYTNKLFDNYSL